MATSNSIVMQTKTEGVKKDVEKNPKESISANLHINRICMCLTFIDTSIFLFFSFLFVKLLGQKMH